MSKSIEISAESSHLSGNNYSTSKYMERFKALHKRREDARKLNHEQVVEEDRLSKLPKNFEAKRRRQEWELNEIEARKEADNKGEDYDRIKALNTQADIADSLEAAKRRTTNPDKGFASYEAMSMRQYERLTNNLKPNLESYEKMKEVVGDAQFYPSADTLIVLNPLSSIITLNIIVYYNDCPEIRINEISYKKA